MSLPTRLAASAVAAAALFTPIRSQCTPQWSPGDPLPAPIGYVNTSTSWDPDGAGPAATMLVFGGNFTVGSTPVAQVATYDGAAWTAVGTLTAQVTAMTVHNGELYAATSSGTATIHRWDGVAWNAIGSASGTVRTMVSYNGELAIGGSFVSAGGVTVNNVATWNGSTWAALGSGIQGTARTMTVYNSVLYVGGVITSAGGGAVGNLALWNGSSWSAGPSFNGSVDALAIRASTSLLSSYVYVAGAFTSFALSGSTTPAPYCARCVPWTGAWSAVGNGASPILALSVRTTGVASFELASLLTAGSTFRVQKLSGTSWSPLSTTGAQPTSAATTLNWFQGRYTVGMSSAVAAAQAFTGSEWVSLAGRGIHGNVLCIGGADDDLVIGGTFTDISGVVVNHIARGTPDAWTPLGSGLANTGSVSVGAVRKMANGDIVAGGYFDTAGGAPAQSVARWDGSTWHAYGVGIPGTVFTLLELPDGDLVAGGFFQVAGGLAASNIARWNGAAWSPLGAGCSGPVYSLDLLPDGSLVAAGGFATAGGVLVDNIARWDGSAWHALGGGTNGPVNATAMAPNGDLYIGGSFTSVAGITTRLACWSAGGWSPVISFGLNNANVYDLVVHPSGDLLVGGQTFSVSLGPLGSWYSPLVRIHGGGLSPMTVSGGEVYGLAAGDDLAAAGTFAGAGAVVSSGVARFHTPCPATAVTYGSACSGLTGLLTLRSLAAPWIGGSYRLEASTFGPVNLAVVALGTTPISLPLDVLFGDAGPGCLASLLPIALDVLTPVAGSAVVVGAVPLTPALVGATLDAQALQFEFVPTTRTSTSNALELTIGRI